jgi:hypothetical protein
VHEDKWGRACAELDRRNHTNRNSLWLGAIYGYLINPADGDVRGTCSGVGPWVSIIAGAPIFYAASRWIARSRPDLALFGIFLVIDGGLLVGMTESWTGAPFL